MDPEEPFPRWQASTLQGGDRRPNVSGGLALIWTDGPMAVPIGPDTLNLNGGDLLVADADVLDALYKTEGWSARVLHIPDRWIVDRAHSRVRPVTRVFDDTKRVVKMLKQLWAIGDDVAGLNLKDAAIDSTMMSLIAMLSVELLSETADGRLSSHNMATLQRARMTINAQLADPAFGVAALARHLRISPRQLSSLFAPLGLTTAQAILQMRIERGKRLLREPANARTQITRIALACGFRDQNYFSRCFQRQSGETPRQFRKEPGEQEISA